MTYRAKVRQMSYESRNKSQQNYIEVLQERLSGSMKLSKTLVALLLVSMGINLILWFTIVGLRDEILFHMYEEHNVESVVESEVES